MITGQAERIVGLERDVTSLIRNATGLDSRLLGRVDKIETFVIPAKAGIYEDVHQVIIGLKPPGFRFKTGMRGICPHALGLENRISMYRILIVCAIIAGVISTVVAVLVD